MWLRTEKAQSSMPRKSMAALCLLAVTILLAYSRNGPPSSLFESAGHHVRDGRVYYLNAFPGKAFEIDEADAATFHVLQGAYARVFYFDQTIAEADLSAFRPLDSPYASDSSRVYWMGKTIDGANPTTFRVLNANFECSADDRRAYYQLTVIADADPRTFPPDRAVTNCSETSISFAE